MAPVAIQMFTLGEFRVLVRGVPVTDTRWRRRSARQLLKILLTSPNRRLTREEIVELLWPDSEPEAAAANLRSTLLAMRRVLEAPEHSAAPGVVFSDRDSVWLLGDKEVWVDADAFEEAVREASHVSEPMPSLEHASALYQGDYLPDDPDAAWAVGRRESLKRDWVETQLRLSRQLERSGHSEAALQPLTRVLQADPGDERTAAAAMELLVHSGRRAEALRVYDRLAQSLKDELGLEPSSELKLLHLELLHGGVDVSPSRTSSYHCSYPFPAPQALVGRDSELEFIERLLLAGRSTGQAFAIAAPAGTGKSALLGTVAQLAKSSGYVCLAGGCYEERAAMPLNPFHDALLDFVLTQSPEWLRTEFGSLDDVAQIVPELRHHLRLPPDNAARGAIDRVRVFAAVHALLRRMSELGPVLLCLEDLHAADDATLQLFHYLARQTRRLPLVLAATYRSDEALAGQPLAQSLAAMRRERLLEILELPALGQRDTERLITSLLSAAPSERLSESLYTTTAGNPLFVEQLVLALSETGRLRMRGGFWHGTTEIQGAPGVVGEVIGERLRRLSTGCRATLEMASVLGHGFEYASLLNALGAKDESRLLEHLDEAITARVVRETPAGYGFGHAFLRDAVYWQLSAPRRTFLHHRAAESLERLRGIHADDYAAELAHHFCLAGESSAIRAKALHYSLLAGTRAATLSSYPDALGHYRHACDVLEGSEDEWPLHTRIEALQARGFAEANVALYADSVTTLRRVLELSDDPLERARARKVIAFALDHAGEFDELVNECNAGLVEIAALNGPDVREIRATHQQLIGLAWYLQGRFRDVVSLGQNMERDAAGDVGPLLLAHKVSGWGYMGLGQVEPALEHYQRAVELAKGWDKPTLANAYSALGLQEFLAGRFASAREHLETSLSLFHDSANELRAVNTVHIMCQVLIAEGQDRRAAEWLRQTVDLEAEGGERWESDAHAILGHVHALRAEWNEATRRFERALAMRTAAGHLPGIVDAAVALGSINVSLGELERAHPHFVRALTIANGMDSSPRRVIALVNLGRLALSVDDMQDAVPLIDHALALARTVDQTLDYAPALLAAADLRSVQGRLHEALALAHQALEHAKPVEQRIQCSIATGRIYLQLHDLGGALDHAREALRLVAPLGWPGLSGQAHLVCAKALATTTSDAALESFERAREAADAAATPREKAEVLAAYSLYLKRIGRPADASSMELEVHAIRERLHRQSLRVTIPQSALVLALADEHHNYASA